MHGERSAQLTAGDGRRPTASPVVDLDSDGWWFRPCPERIRSERTASGERANPRALTVEIQAYQALSAALRMYANPVMVIPHA